jgi:hypothetical protein
LTWWRDSLWNASSCRWAFWALYLIAYGPTLNVNISLLFGLRWANFYRVWDPQETIRG